MPRIPVYILAVVLLVGGCATTDGGSGQPLSKLEKFDRAETTIRSVLPVVASSYGLLSAAGVTDAEIALIRGAHADFEAGLYKALAAARLRLAREGAAVQDPPSSQPPGAAHPALPAVLPSEPDVPEPPAAEDASTAPQAKKRRPMVTPSTARYTPPRRHPEYDPELCSDDRRFSEATPSGELSMDIDNPALEGFFEPGASYYIEIRRA